MKIVDYLELRFRVVVPHPEFAATRVCQVSLRPLTDGTHLVTGAVGSLSDVTESVELRRELELRASGTPSQGASTVVQPSSCSTGPCEPRQAQRPGSPRSTSTLTGSKASTTTTATPPETRPSLPRATRSVRHFEPDDVAGRLGGDEFLVVCPGISSVDEGLGVR